MSWNNLEFLGIPRLLGIYFAGVAPLIEHYPTGGSIECTNPWITMLRMIFVTEP